MEFTAPVHFSVTTCIGSAQVERQISEWNDKFDSKNDTFDMSRVEFMKFDSKRHRQIRFANLKNEFESNSKFDSKFANSKGSMMREIEFRVVKFEIRNAEWMH